MNKQILFKSALSLVAAVAAGSAFAATTSVYTEPFDLRNDGAIASPGTVWTSGANDQSEVVADPRGTGKVLELKTEGDTLTNSLATVDATTINTAFGNGDAVVFDAEVKFVPSDSLATDLPEGTDDTKFALYAYAPDGGSTNLVVYHAYLDGEYQTQYTNDIIAVNGALDDPDAFSAISVKVFPYETLLFFTVKLNGTTLTATTPYMEGVDSTWFKTVNNETDAVNKNFSAICFKGTGMVDNLGVSTENDTVTMIQVTLTNGGFTPTGLTTNGVDVTPIPATIDVADGTTVAFTVKNGDDATKTIEINASASVNSIDFTGATFGWPEYLGDAVNSAYQIDDANDLDMLRKGVAAGLATSGETFMQTADIDMASAGAFAGIGTYTANLNSGVAFQGTYDGQGYKISNIDFTQRNYGGVFNQVKGGTIKDLTVENITCSGFSSSVNEGEWGCAIVGNAGQGATLLRLASAGNFGTAETPASHNVAGIVIRACGGASNTVNNVVMLETLVKDCTNNATLHGFYTKAAGICALTQDQNGVPNDYVLFDGCVNNANIAMVEATGSTLAKIGRDGLAGILGYVDDSVKIKDCVNNGTLTSALSTAKIGGIIGWAYSKSLSDLGGNANASAKSMIGTYGSSTVTGFQYATVDNGVATTISGSIAADGEYLLEGNAAPVIELADGESIAFDTALGYTLDDTGITAATGCDLSDATVGTVTTYTAAAAAPAGWVDDPTTVSNQTAAVAYPTLAGTALAAADAQKLTVWAKANSVAFDSAEAATESMVEAYLLNCAPTAPAIAAEKDAFVLDIEFDSTGAAVIKLPEGKSYNGKLQMKGSNDLSTWTNTATTQGFQFFKYELSL